MKYFYCYSPPIGPICLAEEENSITDLIFLAPEGDAKKRADQRAAKMLIGDMNEERETDLIRKAYQELEEYLAGKRRDFDIPLAPKGTDFQKSVWNALLQIPYGETCSYKEIATAVGNEKACRAVGMANNSNPIAILIPCHRVVGTNGKLVGYGGGLKLKEKLLKLEGWKNTRVLEQLKMRWRKKEC